MMCLSNLKVTGSGLSLLSAFTIITVNFLAVLLNCYKLLANTIRFVTYL